MNRPRQYRGHPRRQQGMALLIALILLIGLTLISIAGVNTSVMELRMARNIQGSNDTFQVAMAGIDYALSDSANLPTSGPLGTWTDVTLPTAYTDPGGIFHASGNDSVSVQAQRLADCQPPPRVTAASSLVAFSAFDYELQADIDKVESGMGKGGMLQGYKLLGPKC